MTSLALVRGTRAMTMGIASSLPDPPGQMGFCLPAPPPLPFPRDTERVRDLPMVAKELRLPQWPQPPNQASLSFLM